MKAGRDKIVKFEGQYHGQWHLAGRLREPIVEAKLAPVGTTGGLSAIVAEGKQVLHVNGRDYLLELPLRADFALLRGSVTDKFGNTIYNATTRTFNPMMAMAADHVLVGTCEIVEVGDLDPNCVVTSGIFVDSIVGGEKPWQI